MIRVAVPFLALLIAACADVGDAPMAETEADAPVQPVAVTPAGVAVPIDTAASRIEWTAAKVTRTHQGGFREFAGVVYVDGDVVTGAEVTAQTASIFADVARLTEHLKTDDFFDAAVNPEVRFLVTELTPIPPGDSSAAAGATHRAAGSLTMHGQTNQLAFPITVGVSEGVVTADADFIINRKHWGLNWTGAPDDLVRDDVRVRLHIVSMPTVVP
jgi:polyisoprenoid-binding protein YceI